jgi:two-component system sensor histidine kinase KdpD
VVANLVTNSVRFNPPGVPVLVRAEQPAFDPGQGATSAADQVRGQFPEQVRLHISDCGPGIDESRWDTMFTPFQRLGDHDGNAGLGLGLAIAQGFTEAMRGKLTPSATPGGGLTMTVTLKVAP